MAGSTPGTPSTSSRAARTAARSAARQTASESAAVDVVTTPSKKQLRAATKSASKHATPSKTHSSTSSSLHPSLPRPPSWQAALASQLASASKTSPKNRLRRSKTSSGDERDPGDSVCSTEDEESDDHEDLSVLQATPSKKPGRAGAAINKTVTSTSITAGTPIASTSDTNEKQNICVCVRIRPSAPGAPELENPIWDLDRAKSGRISLTEHHPITAKRGSSSASDDAYAFKFDSLLLPPHPTSNLYEQRIRPVVNATLDGYNGTIFSYGQTGSGKTHTMTGSDDEPGVLPLAIADIFNHISTDTDREWLLRVSYLEIYNENLRDLLEPVKDNAKDKLAIVEDKHGRVIVRNLAEEVVSCSQDVVNLLNKGEDNRSVAGTDWNHRSSRSHCVFSMTIESRPKATLDAAADMSIMSTTSTELPYADDDESGGKPSKQSSDGKSKVPVRRSQLNLIDLAGSERATSHEERRKEGAFINKSLLFLGTVIQKLAEGKKSAAHIPYRDSKLTRLLETSLSGNARIAIVCTISPEGRHGSESVSTLKFAQRAAKVVTRAERGIVSDSSDALIAQYEEQLAALRAQLAQKSNADNEPRPVQNGEELESERSARLKAEDEAKDSRMEILRLNEQIRHLNKQIITGTSQADGGHHDGAPRTPSTAERHYGDLGTGGGPSAIGRGRPSRRISEVAFGIASPMPHHRGIAVSSSMRSISSALDTIKSPGGIEESAAKIEALEKEIEDAKKSAGEREKASQAQIAELREQNKELEETLEDTRTELGREAILREDSERQFKADALKHAQSATEAQEANKQQAQEHERSMIKLLQEMDELRAQVQSKEKSLNDLQGIMKTSSSESTTKAAALQQALDQMAQENAQLVKKARRVDELEKEKAGLDERLASAQDNEQKQTREIAELQDKAKRIEELEKEIANLQARLSSLQASEKQKSSDSVGLQTELERQREQLAKAQEQHQAQVNKMKKEHEKAQTTIQELQKANDSQTASQARQKAEIAKMQEDLHQETVRHAKEQEHSQKTIAAFAKQVASLKHEQETQVVKREEQHSAEIATLQSALQGVRTELSEGKAIIASQAAKIDDLDKKEAARSRLAQLKASNTPPDFNALHSRMQAVAGKSGNKSLSSSTSSNRSEGEQDRTISTLRGEIETLQDKLREARTQSSNDQGVIQDLQVRIRELESDIAMFRKKVDRTEKLLLDLQNGNAEADVASQLEAMSLNAGQGQDSSGSRAYSAARSPLGAISGHRSAVSVNLPYRSSGLSTPTKKESHGFNWMQSRPEPLPTPPGVAESRKHRRLTTEHELEKLRTGGMAARSRSLLQSPKLERSETPDYSFPRTRTISETDSLQSSPARVKKSSGSSTYSRY